MMDPSMIAHPFSLVIKLQNSRAALLATLERIILGYFRREEAPGGEGSSIALRLSSSGLQEWTRLLRYCYLLPTCVLLLLI